jgi:hypothetical protein
MRSKTLILPDESQEDFDRLAAGWRAEYGDDGQATTSLLERVIQNDWFLQRAERRYMEEEAELAAKAGVSAVGWSEEQHHKLELFLRYKTGAERSFYRAFHSLRGLRKDKIKEELDLDKVREEVLECAREAVTKAHQEMQQEQAEQARVAAADPARRSKDTFGEKKASKKKGKLTILDQWVEVKIEDGKTVTRLYPSNEELIKEGKKMDSTPDMVYRRMSFSNGIPEEYRWASASHPERFERGGMGTQRMTVDTWLEVIEREAASGTGHVGPTGVGNLPRPKERGGCDCEVCTRNQEVLERRAA